MNQVTLLRHALRPHLAWHGAGLSFVAAFLIALLRVKTVNFAELATAFSGEAQTDSHYKRLQRFFRDYELNYAELAQAVVNLMAIPEPWTLSLDRTEWQFGNCVFNILMLGVVHEGVAFPVVWCWLDKRGNSNRDERIALFNQFLERFGERELACLTADREFVGKDWFEYLLSHPLTPFRIRIRENYKLSNGSTCQKAKVLFADLAVGQTKILRHKRRLWGHWVYIAAVRFEDNSLLIVATPSAPKSAISDYAKRWSIETLFGIFKTRGFCLESTHLTEPEEHKPLRIKKHGRRAKSIFRYRFDHLRCIVLNLDHKMNDFSHALQLLSCT
ncbi:IS4 family transposase [Leptolyngbya ohadii]|uniref:IS4 family transposase n=1 Tax=Leptolyngbya ohadii TaxID=1962290 RepID=UPI000B5A1809|nr:IS4 family transposase [Leptolyngbya ohadii]